MKVWYPSAKPRLTGLRLVPGWNEVPVSTATLLIERGIVKQTAPSARADSAEPDEAEGFGRRILSRRKRAANEEET